MVPDRIIGNATARLKGIFGTLTHVVVCTQLKKKIKEINDNELLLPALISTDFSRFAGVMGIQRH